MKKARITEIFSSIQGEGLYAGRDHIFVRFYGCNLACEFCDENIKNIFRDYTPEELSRRIFQEEGGTISLTGGEPLLYADFLKELLPLLKKKNKNIYLETNGTLKDELLKILEYTDTISMDFKLPSSTGIRAYWGEHSIFLKEAVKKEVFVKTVVTGRTVLSDIERAVAIIKYIDRDIPFIIQPATSAGGIERIELLDIFFDRAKDYLNNVRIIPQMHKILGVR